MIDLTERLLAATNDSRTPPHLRELIDDAGKEIQKLHNRIHTIGNDASRVSLHAIVFEMLAEAADAYITTLEAGTPDGEARKRYRELKDKASPA
jgi:hypothetical protein